METGVQRPETSENSPQKSARSARKNTGVGIQYSEYHEYSSLKLCGFAALCELFILSIFYVFIVHFVATSDIGRGKAQTGTANQRE